MTYLEHLDEGNAEVQVRDVSADEAQAEEDADRDDSPQIDAPRHLDRLTSVNKASIASHELRHDGCEDLVVRREDNGVACWVVMIVSAVRTAIAMSFAQPLTEVQRI